MLNTTILKPLYTVYTLFKNVSFGVDPPFPPSLFSFFLAPFPKQLSYAALNQLGFGPYVWDLT